MSNFRSTLLGLLISSCLVVHPAMAQMSPRQRTDVSDQMMRDLTRSGQTIEQQQRVQRVFSHLLAFSTRKDTHYRVAVLRSNEVNAYALPDGRVVITTALLSRLPADNDNALAFVLAHEISHIEKRHAERQVQQDTASRVVIGILAGNSDLGRVVGGLSSQLITSGHSRGMESEADRAGLALMDRAGYDPNGALVTLRILQNLEGQGMRVFPTHPRATDRYRNCVAWMNEHHVTVYDSGTPSATSKSVVKSLPARSPASNAVGGASAGIGRSTATQTRQPVGHEAVPHENGLDEWTKWPEPSGTMRLVDDSPLLAQESAHPLPDVVLRDRVGRKVALTRYLGKKPILLYLYSQPADQTGLNLQNLQTQMDNLSVQAVAIQGDRSLRDRAMRQFQTVAVAYPLLLDEGGIAHYYGASDATLILVGTDGRELRRWSNVGAVDKLSGELAEALRSVVASPPEPNK